MPGNRDDFPFSLPSGLYRVISLSCYCAVREDSVSQFGRENLSSQHVVESFYNRDFTDDTTEMSQKERRFIQSVEKIQLRDGHYEIPLPFKNDVSWFLTRSHKPWRGSVGCLHERIGCKGLCM